MASVISWEVGCPVGGGDGSAGSAAGGDGAGSAGGGEGGVSGGGDGSGSLPAKNEVSMSLTSGLSEPDCGVSWSAICFLSGSRTMFAGCHYAHILGM